MSLQVYCVNDQDNPSNVSKRYAAVQEPILLNLTCDLSLSKRVPIYIELAKAEFTEKFFSNIVKAGESLNPGKRIYLLVGLKPEAKVTSSFLEKLIRRSMVDGILLNAFDSSQVASNLKVLL